MRISDWSSDVCSSDLPLTMAGLCPAVPLRYVLPVASAQVKSAVLLAGLNTPGVTMVIEKTPTRDHSERMLTGFGAQVTVEDAPEGRIISIRRAAELKTQAIIVPGDRSSAAFQMVAAPTVPGSDLLLENRGTSDARRGGTQSVSTCRYRWILYNKL